MFKLSKRSIDRLSGVDETLQKVFNRAIEITPIDFGVTEGRRSKERQEKLVEEGKSQTMKSKHIDGKAVDVVAYLGSKISWDMKYYFKIADAIAEAAKEENVKIRWGGAWSVSDIRNWVSAEDSFDEYVKLRKSQGRTPFIDAPHFELMS